jgi:catechol 2,3-dioxygenase-like lactoylglutathione lyase family enzyme
MTPRVTLITLGVDDLDRSLAFYRDGLGLLTKGIVGTEFEHGAVAFFDLQPGLQLALWRPPTWRTIPAWPDPRAAQPSSAWDTT